MNFLYIVFALTTNKSDIDASKIISFDVLAFLSESFQTDVFDDARIRAKQTSMRTAYQRLSNGF